MYVHVRSPVCTRMPVCARGIQSRRTCARMRRPAAPVCCDLHVEIADTRTANIKRTHIVHALTRTHPRASEAISQAHEPTLAHPRAHRPTDPPTHHSAHSHLHSHTQTHAVLGDTALTGGAEALFDATLKPAVIKLFPTILAQAVCAAAMHVGLSRLE